MRQKTKNKFQGGAQREPDLHAVDQDLITGTFNVLDTLPGHTARSDP